MIHRLHVASDRDTEEGLERLRAVVRANPRSTAFVALANALCENGRDEEAETVARQGLGEHPTLVTGQVALGRALLARGRVDEAQERLVEAAKNSPENGDAFRWLGELILRRGSRDQARVLLEYAEELVPSDSRVAELLTEAGGVPQPRQARPKTDFENTRVGNSKAMRELAERMHEDPPAPAPGKGAPTPRNGATAAANPEEAITAEFEPRAAIPATLPDLPHVAPLTPAPVTGNAKAVPKVPKPTTVTAARSGRSIPGQGLSARLRTVWQRTGARPRVAALGIVVVVLGSLAWLFKTSPPPSVPAQAPPALPVVAKPTVAAVDLTADIAAGTLDSLSAVRALGKRLAEMDPPDPDQLASAAFASALLANDYGGGGNADALEMAATAGKAVPANEARTGLIEATRALAALTAGDLPDAQAAAQRAVAASPRGAEALLVLGRTHLRTGDLAAARVALEGAVARVPVITTAALDLAAVHLDAGDLSAAEHVLRPLVAERNDLRAQLLLAEIERAAGKSILGAGLHERCRAEGRDSVGIRTWCAAEAALTARLAGERSAATRAGRGASAGGGRNPRALAQGAMVLANLGEIDQASDVLRKVRNDTTSGFVPRVWAELAVALGRGEVPAASIAVPPTVGPETRLVAARIAFARAGKLGLREFLAKIEPALIPFDPDLAAFALLADEAPPDAPTKAALDERAEKGSGLSAYVAGRLALAAGDAKTAAARLHRALLTSAEACAASRLLLGIDKKLRPAAVNAPTKVAALVRAHGGCAAPSR